MQSNIAEDLVTINGEIKKVDIQMNMLDNQEQLLKKRKSLNGIKKDHKNETEK